MADTKLYATWKSSGIPIQSDINQQFWGNEYFVDGTNGLDSNRGDRPYRAFKTIQAAVTKHLADTTSLGDVIRVFPGTYAESITASSFTNLALVGVHADAVIIAPTASHGLLIGTDGATATTMTNSLIKNISFLTPSTSNTTYAALTVCYMTKSVIEDCKFKGTTNTGTGSSATIGLQIGNRTDTAWEFHEHSRISRCEFTANAGRTTQVGIGIQVGAHTAANPEYKGFKSMIIEDCIIGAKDRGIRMCTGLSSCNGTVIRRNVITGHEGAGVGVGIISKSTDGTDTLTMILDNRIVAVNDCIQGFSTGNVQGNIVAVNTSGTPAAETA